MFYIISFSSEPEIFIMRAMTPAKPVKIIVNKDERMAVAVIPDDMMSLAIGRNGVNLRMASLLTGFQIEPIKESEYNTESSIDYAATVIEEIEELAKSVKTKLIDAGLENIQDLAEKGVDGLKEIAGIGPKTVDKIWDVVQKYLDTEDED